MGDDNKLTYFIKIFNPTLRQYQMEMISLIANEKIQSLNSFDIEILKPKELSKDIQIKNIKKQLKYEKNPLVIKNLNREMNKLLKTVDK